jgi:hypothetical protein
MFLSPFTRSKTSLRAGYERLKRHEIWWAFGWDPNFTYFHRKWAGVVEKEHKPNCLLLKFAIAGLL